MITIFITLLVIVLLFWAVRTLLAAFHAPEPIPTIVYVVGVVLIVLWLLKAFGLWSGGPSLGL